MQSKRISNKSSVKQPVNQPSKSYFKIQTKSKTFNTATSQAAKTN